MSQENSMQPRKKRVKIVSACGECRRKKTKCDGELPCHNCQKSGVTCLYPLLSPSEEKRIGPSKLALEAIEDRLKTIENMLRAILQSQSPIADLDPVTVEEFLKRSGRPNVNQNNGSHSNTTINHITNGHHHDNSNHLNSINNNSSAVKEDMLMNRLPSIHNLSTLQTSSSYDRNLSSAGPIANSISIIAERRDSSPQHPLYPSYNEDADSLTESANKRKR